MTLRAVLFDLDDTLYGYEPCNQAGLQAAWQLMAQTVSGFTYEQFTNIHDRVREQLAADLAGSAACHNRALFFKHIADQVAPKTGLAGDLYDRYWERFLEQAQPGPKESREVVAELARRGYLLGLVSNHVALPQLRKVRVLGLESYFDAIVTSEEVGVEKPAPAAFLMALERLGVSANEAVFVGDNPDGDIGGAIGAGISMTILTVEYAPSAVCDEADHTVSKIGEVLQILD